MLIEKDKKMLMVQLTYACNLNCKHCAYKDIRGYSGLTFPEFVDILTSYDYDVIKLSGGEPTILNYIDLYIKEAKKYAETILYTNLTKIPKEMPDKFLVSYYGLGYHPLIIGDHEKNIQILRNLFELKKRGADITLNTPVFNRSQILSPSEAIDFAKNIDLPLRMVKLLQHGGCVEMPVLSHEGQLKIAQKGVELYNKAYYTCSLGGEPRCKDKITITPTGERILCTAEVRSVKCARREFKRIK